ncbi:Uncharacterised protein [uncultured archaeon]|nr:Uncharacterised protein [uncultured archaeon]
MRFAYIILGLLLFAATAQGFSYTKDEAVEHLIDAEIKLENVTADMNGFYATYQNYVDNCLGANEAFAKIRNEVSTAGRLYNESKSLYNSEDYTNSYDKSTNSIIFSDEARNDLDFMPGQIELCKADERRQNASNTLTQMKAERNKVMAAVLNNTGCSAAYGQWTAAEDKNRLASTYFTGSDYARTITTAQEAMALYQASGVSLQACANQTPTQQVQNQTQPEQPVQTENYTAPECRFDSDCSADKYCSTGKCAAVPCSCGTVVDRQCQSYECCSNSDCLGGKSCSNHVCVAQGSGTQGTTPISSTGFPGKYCPLPAFVLLGLVAMLVSKNI